MSLDTPECSARTRIGCRNSRSTRARGARLHVYGVGEDDITALTRFGIETLQEVIADQRAAGRAPPKPGAPE
jgi:hypothetical protein